MEMNGNVVCNGVEMNGDVVCNGVETNVDVVLGTGNVEGEEEDKAEERVAVRVVNRLTLCTVRVTFEGRRIGDGTSC